MGLNFDINSYPGEKATFEGGRYSKHTQKKTLFNKEWIYTSQEKKAFIRKFSILKTNINTYFMIIVFRCTNTKIAEDYFKNHNVTINFSRRQDINQKTGIINQIESIKNIFQIIKATNVFVDHSEKSLEAELNAHALIARM